MAIMKRPPGCSSVLVFSLLRKLAGEALACSQLRFGLTIVGSGLEDKYVRKSTPASLIFLPVC